MVGDDYKVSFKEAREYTLAPSLEKFAAGRSPTRDDLAEFNFRAVVSACRSVLNTSQPGGIGRLDLLVRS